MTGAELRMHTWSISQLEQFFVTPSVTVRGNVSFCRFFLLQYFQWRWYWHRQVQISHRPGRDPVLFRADYSVLQPTILSWLHCSTMISFALHQHDAIWFNQNVWTSNFFTVFFLTDNNWHWRPIHFSAGSGCTKLGVRPHLNALYILLFVDFICCRS